MKNAARLARDLLCRAIAAFAVVPVGARSDSLVAIDAFVDQPAPATYMAATRLLSEAHRRHHVDRLKRTVVGRAHARGMDRLARVPGLDPAILEVLGSQPADPRSGARLAALAALVETHLELAARVAGQADALRKQLASGYESMDETPRAIRSARGRPARAARNVRRP